MNWGKWIIVAFIMFALFIGILVTVCVREDITLVSKEYYKDELVYQDQMTREANTNALNERPTISVNNNQLQISYSRFPEISKGELKLFRPSDAALDQQFAIDGTDETEQSFIIKNPTHGFYRARMSWEQEGKEFFLEQIIIL
jgi:hypothetical protein